MLLPSTVMRMSWIHGKIVPGWRWRAFCEFPWGAFRAVLPTLQKAENMGKSAIEFWYRFTQNKLFCDSRPIREESSDRNSPTTINVDQPFAEGLRFLSSPQRNWNTDMQAEKALLPCLAETSQVPGQGNIQQHSNRKWIFIDDEYSLHFNLLCWPPCHKYNGVIGEKNDFRIEEIFETHSTVAVKFCQAFFQPSKMSTPGNDKAPCYCSMINIISEQIPLI